MNAPGQIIKSADIARVSKKRRYPFLMVDRVRGDESTVGIKNVTATSRNS